MLLRWNVSILLVFLILVAETVSGDPLCDHIMPDTNCKMCINSISYNIHDDCCDISIPDTNIEYSGFFTEKFDENLNSQVIFLLSYIFQDLENPSRYKLAVLITAPIRTIILRCWNNLYPITPIYNK